METMIIESRIHVLNPEELSPIELELVNCAIVATSASYHPYSNFSVGAALRLKSGDIVVGCNQENAAFSPTMCAERSAIFSAGATHPDDPVVMLAIAARDTAGKLLEEPITPCGTCRQVLIETEQRHHQPIRILLYGTRHIYAIDGIKNLMPLSFTDEVL